MAGGTPETFATQGFNGSNLVTAFCTCKCLPKSDKSWVGDRHTKHLNVSVYFWSHRTRLPSRTVTCLHLAGCFWVLMMQLACILRHPIGPDVGRDARTCWPVTMVPSRLICMPGLVLFGDTLWEGTCIDADCRHMPRMWGSGSSLCMLTEHTCLLRLCKVFLSTSAGCSHPADTPHTK